MSRAHRIAFCAILLLFLASRAYVLFFADIQGSTLAAVNVMYALTFRRAANEGVPFYAEIENSRSRAEERPIDAPPPQPIECRVEYPPLAIEWMRIPTFFQPRPKADATLRKTKESLPIAFFTSEKTGDAIERATSFGPVFAKPDDLDAAVAWVQKNS